jgi:flavorubredoxin
MMADYSRPFHFHKGSVTPGQVVTHPGCKSNTREEDVITNQQAGTRVDEIVNGIYRISTPLDILPGGFSVNQYLIVDDEPLLFHTGWRRMFATAAEAISKVIPVDRLRHVGLSHFEGDECGAMNEFLDVAPAAVPFSSAIGAMISVNDFAKRPAHGLEDGEEFSTGNHRLQWIYTPHVPHGWDCGVIFDKTTGTLFCGDLFTQGGANCPPVTEADILGPSELFRKPLDYFAHAAAMDGIVEKLADLHPAMLACQHGSAYRGDGSALLLELSRTLAKERLVTAQP